MAANKKNVENILPPLFMSSYNHPGHLRQEIILTGVNPSYGKKELEDTRLYTGVASKFHDYAAVELWAEDGTWYALGRCYHAVGNDVRVKIHQIVKCAGEVDTELHERFIVKHKGINKKWCVIDTTKEEDDDDRFVFHTIKSKEDAFLKRDTHVKALAR